MLDSLDAATPITRLGRKRSRLSLPEAFLLVGLLGTLVSPPASAYLEQAFSGTAASSGSIRLLFHLNEISGTSATDAGKYSNSGTLTNFPASPWTGTALNFDGTDDFISVTSASSLNLASGLTLEAWVNTALVNPALPQTILSKWDETNGRRAYLLALGVNRKVQFSLSSDGTATFTAASAAALTANTWYHVSATYDGATMKIFINGLQDGSLAGPGSIFASPALLRVGARGNAASAEENFFNGTLDEARVLDFARTDFSQYHVYHFNESGTTPPSDSGGYNHAATLVGAPSYGSAGARYGNGLALNGTSQYADSLYIGPDENGAALSAEAWIRPTGVAGTQTILASETVGSTRLKLRLSGANVQFLLKTGATTTLTSAGTVAAGALAHVAATWDGATMRIFINGVQDANTAAKSGSLAQVNRTLRIGASAVPADFFAGTIDEPRVLNIARTAFNAGAVVNEIALSPPSGNQWIELYNGGGATINLAGWVFKNTSDSSTYTVPATGTRTLAAGAFLVIELGSGTDTASQYFTGNDPTCASACLNNGDLAPATDTLSVYPNGTIAATNLIGFVAWGGAPSSSANGIAAGAWARQTFVGVAPTAQSIGLLADGNDEEGWKDWGGLSPTTKGASNATATAAGVVAFHAKPSQESGVDLAWATALEPGHLGFHLYRSSSPSGPFERIPSELLLGNLGSPFGARYAFHDAAGRAGDWYQLEDLDTALRPTRHPAVQAGAPDASEEELMSRLQAAGTASLRPRPASVQPLAPPSTGMAPGHLNLAVTTTGIFAIGLDQLRSAFGKEKARAGDFVVTDGGATVPVRMVEGSTRLEFFATGAEGKYSPEHVYQVRPRKGSSRPLPMKERMAPVLTDLMAVDSVPSTTRVEEDRVYFIASPETDFFFHDIVFNQRGPVSIPLEVDRLPGPARLRGDLVGMTEVPEVPRDHHVVVRLNGIQVYEGFFEGTQVHRFDVPLPDGLLRDRSEVEIEAVADGASDKDVFLINWIEVEAPRALRASADRLEFATDGRGPFRIRGFTSSDIRILDVTKPNAPVSLTRLRVDPETDGTFTALFQEIASPVGLRRYYAAARPTIVTPALRVPPVESDLKARSNRGSYVVITAPAFHEPLEPLLALRRSEGFETRSVDVEAIYDQFGHGNKSPEAIRDFVKAAASWDASPRFLLLAGGASLDPRGHLGTPFSDLVPTKLFVTRKYHYEAADDGFFTRGLPISVGRLPAQSPEEMAAAVGKIVEFESHQSDHPLGRALFVADDRNARSGLEDPTFERTSDLLASGLSDAGVAIHRLSLAQSEHPREELNTTLEEGVDLVNFLGHGGPQIWTSQGILVAGDAAQLANGPGRYFTVFSMTCFDGAFTYPYGDSLAWSLVKAPGRGAVAAFSPSTLLDPGPHADLDRLLLEGGFRGGEVRLGDLVRQAERSLVSGDAAARDMVDAFNLIGDPAMRLRWSER